MFEQSVMLPDDIRVGTVVIAASPGLPTATQLLCSFQGTRFEDHEVLRSARALAVLHGHRVAMRDVRMVAEVDDRRRELIEDIDDWIGSRSPCHDSDATIHAETLGTVIDRMAWGWVDANQVVEIDGARDHQARKRWHRLAELIDGYTELIGDLLRGGRRLPDRG
ncbi:DUF4254 domain-containing protein [Nocardia sp. NBC_01329]|uniref:DUF4254 domain-containing protein n=1 Tax=Nocardia sp. NBC_01329 TaxID=2903594 RepID=UPI002E12B148|nr:DUF4254 domain-containing protein [Nocardia sp. NBC_01329]